MASRRAFHQRYNHSEKGRARVARYEASEKAKARHARNNAKTNRRRLYVAHRYVGVAVTERDVAAITAHIKDRLHAFKRQQTRAQAKGL